MKDRILSNWEQAFKILTTIENNTLSVLLEDPDVNTQDITDALQDDLELKKLNYDLVKGKNHLQESFFHLLVKKVENLGLIIAVIKHLKEDQNIVKEQLIQSRDMHKHDILSSYILFNNTKYDNYNKYDYKSNAGVNIAYDEIIKASDGDESKDIIGLSIMDYRVLIKEEVDWCYNGDQGYSTSPFDVANHLLEWFDNNLSKEYLGLRGNLANLNKESISKVFLYDFILNTVFLNHSQESPYILKKLATFYAHPSNKLPLHFKFGLCKKIPSNCEFSYEIIEKILKDFEPDEAFFKLKVENKQRLLESKKRLLESTDSDNEPNKAPKIEDVEEALEPAALMDKELTGDISEFYN